MRYLIVSELKMESRHKKYFTDPTTNSFKSGQDDAGQPAIGENEFANVNKRRRSVSNQPRVHPATRLAAFAMQSSETTTEKHVNSAPSEFSGSYKDLSTHIKKLWPTSHSIDPGRLRGVSSSSPRQSSDQTMSTMRILRPRYPRTPIPVTALLLKPKRSPRNPRKSTDVKSSQLFPPLSATVTTDTASLNSQSPAPETVSTPESALLLSPKLSPMKLRNSTALKSSHLFPPLSTSATTDNSNCNPDTPVSVANTTPKPRTPRLRSRSGSRLTPVGRRTPRNKTPGSVKYSESATPKTSRSGTPKGTQKFLKVSVGFISSNISAEPLVHAKLFNGIDMFTSRIF